VILPAASETSSASQGINTTAEKTSGFRDEDHSAALDTFEEFSFNISITDSQGSGSAPPQRPSR